MKLTRIHIHNYRSIIDVNIDAHDFIMFVGANNAGKSNCINALRCFYGDLPWTDNDFPKIGNQDEESWTELSFDLSNDEWKALDDKYKNDALSHSLVLKRYFKGEKAKVKQNNIYAVVNGDEQDKVFYAAKSLKAEKCGKIIYIPALTSPDDQLKTSGPSPLRDILNYILGRGIHQSSAYTQLMEAFNQLNHEASSSDGFLAEISRPLNDALKPWNVEINLSVDPISPETITKYLFNYSFSDQNLANTSFGLDRFGHGFQRAVIFELIQLAANIQKKTRPQENRFDPDYTLFLFEEPEAFLHPAQQENMAYYLRDIAKKDGQQVIVTSHSPVFVSKNCDDLGQICRLQKSGGVSAFYQLKPKDIQNLKEGGDLREALERYANNSNIDQTLQTKARELLYHSSNDDIAKQHEMFRFQLWLDSERAAMFFADKVLLVEGDSEKALFNYLLANKWHDLAKERIYVVVAFGKFNYYRFINLFEAYGIQHGMILDSDNNKKVHALINHLIRDRKTSFTLAEPFEFDNNLETFLGLPVPHTGKPLKILQALQDGTITKDQIDELRKIFCTALAIQTDR